MKKQLQLITPVLFMISANLTGYGQQSVGEKFTDGDFQYKITSLSPDKEVSVYEYNGTATEVIIPSTVDYGPNTYTVTAIGENNDEPNSTQPFREKGLTSVKIPNTVTIIGLGAFNENSQLTEVTIPNSVTIIRRWAFSRNGLTEVTIPNSVTIIGEKAFYQNTNLKLVTVEHNIPPTLDATAFGQDRGQIDLVVPEVAIDEYNKQANGWTGFKSITFGIFTDNDIRYIVSSSSPPEVEIREYVGTATGVTIPSKVKYDGTDYYVTTIGNNAFSRKGLTSLTFADQSNVTRIDSSAFAHNTLTEVTIPGSVTAIGYRAFWIDWETKLKGNGLTRLTFVDQGNLKVIGRRAFMNNQLIRVTIPSSVTTIWQDAFQANELTEVIFSTSSELTRIRNSVFKNNKLTSVTIPDGVTSIGLSAFSANRQLTQVTIPDRVTSIGPYAFDHMPLGGTVRVEATVPPSVAATAFDRSSIAVDVPRSALEAYHAANDWTGFRSIGIFTGNDIEYGITDITTNEVMVLDYSGSATAVEIPGTVDDNNETYTVTSIGQEALRDNQLTEVTIPSSVTTIESGAFRDNQLNSVTIPGGVTRIDSIAFKDNPNLGLVTLEATDPPSLHENAFADRGQIDLIVPVGTREDYLNEQWTGFRSITFGIFTGNDIKYGITNVTTNEVMVLDYSGSATAVEIPGTVDDNNETYTVTSIGQEALRDNQLTEVTIPSSVTTIESGAFSDNQLNSVTIPGGVTRIDSIAFKDNPNLGLVTVEATDPPSLHENAFADRGQIDLIVPVGTREDYLNERWTGFRSITFGIFTGNDIKYGITAVNPNEVKVMDYTGSATEVEIPETVDDNGETYTVSAIGANAFNDNPDLAKVKIEATDPPLLHENAFADRGQIDLIVPTGQRQAYLDHGWTGFRSITEESLLLTAGSNIEFRGFTFYPNPARDKVYINPGSGQELKKVNIYTMIGAYLYSENGPVINTGLLPRGTYLFEIVTQQGDRSIKRVIIQ